MKRWLGQLMAMGALAAVLSACGAATSSTGNSTTSNPYGAASTPQASASPVPSASASQAPAPKPVGSALGVRTTGLGSILVDSRGLSLYLFEADRGATSVCYGSCAKFWPPLLTKGSPVAVAGANQMLLGTTRRSDGTIEVTYAGHPLYFYVGDRRPGDTTGEGLNAFGGGWDVLAPNGAKIEGGDS
jgi:predicted lipoprotein with Yx(FWY)xxD motif